MCRGPLARPTQVGRLSRGTVVVANCVVSVTASYRSVQLKSADDRPLTLTLQIVVIDLIPMRVTVVALATAVVVF